MKKQNGDPKALGRALLLPDESKNEQKLVERINENSIRRPDIRVQGESGELTIRRTGFDSVYFVLVLVLLAFGSVMVFSASYADALARFDDSFYFVKKQLLFVFLALIIIPLVSCFDYKFFYRFADVFILSQSGFCCLCL